MNFHIGIYLLTIVQIIQTQISPPKIESIERIRLNAIKVKWIVLNDSGYQFTRNRVVLYDGSNAIEWPCNLIIFNFLFVSKFCVLIFFSSSRSSK